MRTLTSLLLVGGLLAGSSETAEACGGFFCSREAPVDQAGEQIVFDLTTPGTVRMHVRIQYEGPSEQFAWVVPIPEQHPDMPLSVGTEMLFTALTRRTAPVIRLQARTEGRCLRNPRWACNGWWDGEGEGEGEGGDEGGGEGAGGAGGVEVLVEATVGPFDVVLLDADDAQALVAWLQANEYDVPDDLASFLDPYLEGSHMVAMKLTKGADSGDLQPIIITHDGDAGMIPLRLTALAATDDMPMTVWIAGDGVGASTNWPVVEPNTALLPWQSCQFFGGCNVAWRQLVGDAADEAGGRAFSVDRVMRGQDALADLQWLTAGGVEARLRDVNRSCWGEWTMLLQDSRVRSLVESLLLDEVDLSIDEIVACPCCFVGRGIDRETWRDFADAVIDDVLPELREIYESLAEADSITRLYTRISPEEMTSDPVFAIVQGLRGGDEIQATLVTECAEDVFHEDARRRLELADGRVVAAFGSGWEWDYRPHDQVAAVRVIQYGIDAEPEILIDNRDELRAQNGQQVAAQRADVGEPERHDPEAAKCSNYCCQDSNPCNWSRNRRCDCGGQFAWDRRRGECEQQCIPGRSDACVCPSGSNGAQVCQPNGMGYEACHCVGDPAGVDPGPHPHPDPEPHSHTDPDVGPHSHPDVEPHDHPELDGDEPGRATDSTKDGRDQDGGLCATSPGRDGSWSTLFGAALRR